MKTNTTVLISLSFILFFGSSFPYADAAQKDMFPDIEKSIYKEAIQDLQNQEIVEGYDDGMYKPKKTINRAEFLKIVIGGRYPQEISQKKYKERCFEDIRNKYEWYVPYACIAKEQGIIHGYEGKYLQPEKTINFAEAAKIIANTYSDEDIPINISLWYKPYVQYLLINELVPPSINLLNQNLTREEMAEIISRTIHLQEKKLQAYLHYRFQKYKETNTPVWEEFK